MQTYAVAGSAEAANTRWPIQVFSATILLSAALLFFIQPMFARMILPRLGGTPATWNTCLVFFQAALLLGYLYAHVLTTKLNLGAQALLHAVLMFAVLMTLPFDPPRESPGTASSPVWWLMATLTTSVGAPFFLLSSTAPLLQRWFSHASRQDPYFLYAISNVGSLIGLLGYPLAVERFLTLIEQRLLWSRGFFLLAVLIVACGVTAWRAPSSDAHEIGARAVRPDDPQVRWRDRISWLLLAFVPSSLLLGVTTHISTDVAAVPLLWVIPLSLYLLSFVAAFGAMPPALVACVNRVLPFAIVIAIATLILGPRSWWAIAVHLAAFWLVALACHRALADRRPAVEHLTGFYLCVSLGGALGGAFNALVAPVVFTSIAEYPLILSLTAFLRAVVHDSPKKEPWHLQTALILIVFGVVLTTWAMGMMSDIGFVPLLVAFCLTAAIVLAFTSRPEPFAVAVCLAMAAHVMLPSQKVGHVLFAARSFFGVHRVVEDTPPTVHRLWHGTTLHGWQRLTALDRCEPTTYYHRNGPVGQLFDAIGARAESVAVIGLGAGSLACFSNAGARWTFLEIDPVVERVARDASLFTYLRNARGDVGVSIGDGRLTLAKARPESYDVIVVDAFSSDAIPIHLLTREFVELALERLKPTGILGFHISNVYLDLEPVLSATAQALGAAALEQSYRADHSDAGASRWLVMAREPWALAPLASDSRWRQARPGSTIWTDDFSNILDVIAWTPGRAIGEH